jgi:hypothetical protein
VEVSYNQFTNSVVDINYSCKGGSMKTIFLLISLFLTGCYQSVDSVEFEKSIIACGGTKNVDEITSSFIGHVRVRCKDTKTYDSNSVVITREN